MVVWCLEYSLLMSVGMFLFIKRKNRVDGVLSFENRERKCYYLYIKKEQRKCLF